MSDAPDGAPPRVSKRGRSRAEIEARAQAIEARAEAAFADIEAQMRATNARIEERTGRNLVLAIVIALLLGGSFLFSILVIKELFMIFAAGLIGFAAFELATALRVAGRDVPRIPAVIAGVAMVPATFYFLDAGHWMATLAAMAFVSLWRLVALVKPSQRGPAREILTDLGAGILVQAYVVFLGSFAVLLTAKDGGEWWALAFVVIVVATDTGAYASGLLFGRHPMAPLISPKKTWEGFAGSVVTSQIAGVLLAMFALQQPWWVGMVFGVAMVASATGGDLAESLIKRDLGVKDISSWLPGHGGFLDRLDSILPSAAVAYGLYLIYA